MFEAVMLAEDALSGDPTDIPVGGVAAPDHPFGRQSPSHLA